MRHTKKATSIDQNINKETFWETLMQLLPGNVSGISRKLKTGNE